MLVLNLVHSEQAIAMTSVQFTTMLIDGYDEIIIMQLKIDKILYHRP